jgi:hypothetical protein
MGYAEAEVFDEERRTLARASGTFLMLRERRGPASADRRGDASPQ